MTIDARITQAIREAVEEAGQPESLAQSLIAWFDAIATGNGDSDHAATARHHLKELFQSTKVNDNNGEHDN